MADVKSRIVLLCYGLITLLPCTLGKDITIATYLTAPYLTRTKLGNYIGYVPELLEAMGYNYTVKEDSVYGTLDDNNTWNGLMGQVTSGAVDIAGPLTVTSRRLQDVQFSYPIMSVGPVVVMKKPSANRPITEDLVQLLEPLEFSVWLLSFLALLVTGTVLYIISHFNPYEWRRMSKDGEATQREAESFTCLNCFWFILSTLFLQGYVRAPRSIGARIVVAAWWIFVILFIFSYVASLVNFLAAGPYMYGVMGYSKVKSLEDLAHNEEIDIGIVPQGSTEHLFKTSKIPAFQQIYERSVQTYKTMQPKLNTTGQLVQYLRTRPFLDFAVILESDLARFHSYSMPCNIHTVGEGVITKQLSLAVNRGDNELLKDLNTNLLMMVESGRLREIENKWFQRGECSQFESSADQIAGLSRPFYKLNLSTFSGAILILLVGIVLGGLVAIIETLIFKWAEAHSDEDTAPEKTENIDMAASTNDSLLANSETSKRKGATPV